MFHISAALIGLGGILMFFLPYHRVTPASAAPAEKLSLRSMFLPRLFLLAVIGALFSMINGATSSFLSMLGDERGITRVSLFFTVSAVAVLAIRPFIGQIIDRKGLYFVLIPSLIVSSAAMLLIGSAWSLTAIVIAAVMKGLSQSTGQTAIQAECAKRSPASQRGVAMATYYLGGDLGNSAGSSLGGWISEKVGYGSMFSLIGAVVAGGLILTLIQIRKDRADKAGSSRAAA